MNKLSLSEVTLDLRILGPENSTKPPVVFVHGFLVDSRLWDGVAADLAARGHRCYLVDWPLGSHRTPVPPAVDLSPRGVVAMILEALAVLDLTDVTLVGNDSGGALCQFLLDTDHSRIGRLLLTNCDAFDVFPPQPFKAVFAAARTTPGVRLLAEPMRLRAIRHSPIAFGLLAARLDPALTRSWIDPALRDKRIRQDAARFVRTAVPAELLDVSTRLHLFDKPVRIVWGEADRCFKPAMGRRLAATFPNATFVGVPGGRTFLALDEPARVADEIDALVAV